MEPKWIFGKAPLKSMVQRSNRYAPKIQSSRIAVLTFSDEFGFHKSRVCAAKISAKAKCAAFVEAGFRTQSFLVGPSDLEQRIEELTRHSHEPLLVILQRPMPLNPILNALVDIDSLHPLKTCAVAEAASHLVRMFADKADSVAIVGGKGFVGTSLVKHISTGGLKCAVFDQEDDLSEIRNSQAIIACAGVPSLISADMLATSHRLLIDIGFTVSEKQPIPRGDLTPTALSRGEFVTPVPGGMGPLQVAVLIERALKYFGIDEPVKWDDLMAMTT